MVCHVDGRSVPYRSKMKLRATISVTGQMRVMKCVGPVVKSVVPVKGVMSLMVWVV